MPQRYLMPQKEHKALKDELGHSVLPKVLPPHFPIVIVLRVSPSEILFFKSILLSVQAN